MKRSLQINPDHQPATWDQIRSWRDAHEVCPVDTTFGAFDCDERSDQRLKQVVELFDTLPTVQDGKLTWKRADNSFVALTKAELADVYQQVRVNRGVRAALLHVKAEQFNMMDPKPTPHQLKDLLFWIPQD